MKCLDVLKNIEDPDFPIGFSHFPLTDSCLLFVLFLCVITCILFPSHPEGQSEYIVIRFVCCLSVCLSA